MLPEDPAMTRPTVWVVDDSPLDAKQAQKALCDWCSVEVFSDGSTVLEHLSAHPPPDVLVLDWVMPGISGIEVVKFLRSEKGRMPEVPVLLLTARQEPTADRRRAVGRGQRLPCQAVRPRRAPRARPGAGAVFSTASARGGGREGREGSAGQFSRRILRHRRSGVHHVRKYRGLSRRRGGGRARWARRQRVHADVGARFSLPIGGPVPAASAGRYHQGQSLLPVGSPPCGRAWSEHHDRAARRHRTTSSRAPQARFLLHRRPRSALAADGDAHPRGPSSHRQARATLGHVQPTICDGSRATSDRWSA